MSDSEYRRNYQAQQSRIRSFREARREAFPLIWQQSGGTVAAGPFAGLKYLPPYRTHYFTPKLLGTYEKELAATIEEICRTDYQRIIDIGAAEGYYASGLALRNPHTRMTAFEASTNMHPTLKELAAVNGVQGQVEVFGFCTPALLQRHLTDADHALLISDVEGAEYDLLDPQSIPGLRAIDILVEVHDELRPGVTEELRRRFAATHSIEFIAQRRRTLEDLPPGIELPSELAVQAMDEFRSAGNNWLWMKCSAPPARMS